MSRTRKDRPYRVRVNDPREAKTVFHNHEAFGRSGIDYRGNEYGYADHCTADERTTHLSNRDSTNRRPCERHLAWQYGPCNHVSRQELVGGYWAPARQVERVTLHQLTAEFNALGEVDTEPVLPEQHRHAMFGGGWWD